MPSLIKEKHGSKDGEVSEAHCLVCVPLTIIFNVLGDCSWTLVRLGLSLGLLGCLMPFGNRLLGYALFRCRIWIWRRQAQESS